MSYDNGKAQDHKRWAKMYADGMSGYAIAKQVKRSQSTVYYVLRSLGVLMGKPFQKRLAAAARVKAGEDPREVAEFFGRSFNWLKAACAEQRVKVLVPTIDREAKRTLMSVIGSLQNNSKETYETIGKRHGVTKQRVEFIIAESRANGIRFPGRVIRVIEEAPGLNFQEAEARR